VSAFASLLQELDRWQLAGRIADLWLRDDDAVEPTLALSQLLARSAAADVPIVVAAIPMLATEDLAKRLAAESMAVVWQHGISHANNAGPGQKKQELLDASPEVLRGLADGWQRLQHVFLAQTQAVLVPPWNRIAPDLVFCLPGTGLDGLSTYRPRQQPFAAPGVWQVNTHVDVVDWRNGRKFIGTPRACKEIVAHLSARRIGAADPDEPTGILTHHLTMDESAWVFLSDLFGLTNSHPAARWCVPNRE
jgi:hypothetical protein